jgi:hypothetical protein
MPQNLLPEMMGRYILKLGASNAFKKIKASINYCPQVMSFFILNATLRMQSPLR